MVKLVVRPHGAEWDGPPQASRILAELQVDPLLVEHVLTRDDNLVLSVHQSAVQTLLKESGKRNLFVRIHPDESNHPFQALDLLWLPLG
eukprot:2731344-Amphidinium_carterae.1